MAFTVRGYIIKEDKKFSKNFNSLAKANSFLDKMLDKYNCQVEDEVIENNEVKYFCEDRSNFIVETINA